VKAAATLPVLAGFGVRERAQVAGLAGHVDGVVVGSALIDAIDRGDDPASFLADLRPVSAEA
jgi:tryptophan synthase alpha chain